MTKREALAHAGLGRMASLPTVWTDVIAATVLAGGLLSPWPLLPVLVAASLFHIGGGALAQAYDAGLGPRRPRVALGYAIIAVAVLLVASIAGADASAVAAGYPAIGAGVALGAATVTRAAFRPRDPLSPVVAGLTRVLLWFLAALLTAHALSGAVLAASSTLFAYVAGMAILARQDVRAGVTSPWPIALLTVPFIYAMPAHGGLLVASAIYMGALAWVVSGIVLLGARRFGGARRGVERLVSTIALLDALFVASAGRERVALGMLLCFAAAVAIAHTARVTAAQHARTRRLAHRGA